MHSNPSTATAAECGLGLPQISQPWVAEALSVLTHRAGEAGSPSADASLAFLSAPTHVAMIGEIHHCGSSFTLIDPAGNLSNSWGFTASGSFILAFEK